MKTAAQYASEIKKIYFSNVPSGVKTEIGEQNVLDYLLDKGYGGEDNGKMLDAVISELVNLDITVVPQYSKGTKIGESVGNKGLKGKYVWNKYSKNQVKGAYNYGELEFLGSFSQESFEEDVKQYLDRTKWDEISRVGDRGENHSYPNNPYGNYYFWGDEESITYHLSQIAGNGAKVGIYTDERLSQIAKKHFPNIETLETRKSDSLDFHNVSVWSIKDALTEAGRDMQSESEIEKIAKDHLFLDTLKTRNSDSLDFSDQAVWGIKNALKEANHIAVEKIRGNGYAGKGSIVKPTSYEYEWLKKYPDAIIEYKKNAGGDTIVYVNGQTAYNKNDIHGAARTTELAENALTRAYNNKPKNENMEKYYYLKIGNIIKEPKFNNSLGIVSFERDKIKVQEISKIIKNTSADFIDYETFISYMNFGDITIEGCIYETDRDKILLQMEIDNIKKSFEVAEEKKEKASAKHETAHVKKEANELLNQLTETKAGTKDTIEAMEAITTDYNKKHYHGLTDKEVNILSHYRVLQDKDGGHYRKLKKEEQEEYQSILNKLNKAGKGIKTNDIYTQKLEAFISEFPDDAKGWNEATDEIREIAKDVREAYNEQVLDVLEGEPGYIESLNFREFKTPSEWNTKAKEQIREIWVKLPDHVRKNVIDGREGWFDGKAGKGKMVGGDYNDLIGKNMWSGFPTTNRNEVTGIDYIADDNIKVTFDGRLTESYTKKELEDLLKGKKITGENTGITLQIWSEWQKGLNKKDKPKPTKKPKAKKVTLTPAERKYIKTNKKEIKALKDAYPDLNEKQLITKHKSAK